MRGLQPRSRLLRLYPRTAPLHCMGMHGWQSCSGDMMGSKLSVSSWCFSLCTCMAAEGGRSHCTVSTCAVPMPFLFPFLHLGWVMCVTANCITRRSKKHLPPPTRRRGPVRALKAGSPGRSPQPFSAAQGGAYFPPSPRQRNSFLECIFGTYVLGQCFSFHLFFLQLLAFNKWGEQGLELSQRCAAGAGWETLHCSTDLGDGNSHPLQVSLCPKLEPQDAAMGPYGDS